MHEGHRQRMFGHLMNGADGLQDHELLEILLFYAIPRKNTNPIAHSLISAFGSLEGVLNASFEKLLEVDGIGEATATYLTALSTLCERMAKQEKKAPKVFNVHSFSEFLGSRFEGCTEEMVEIYCLDRCHHVRFTKQFTSFLPDKVTIPPEEVGRLVATQRPHSIVIAHNHPGAPSTPSSADDRFTTQMLLLCMVHGATIDDHIIVGKDEPFSYFLSGKLDAIKRACKENIVGEEES